MYVNEDWQIINFIGGIFMLYVKTVNHDNSFVVVDSKNGSEETYDFLEFKKKCDEGFKPQIKGVYLNDGRLDVKASEFNGCNIVTEDDFSYIKSLVSQFASKFIDKPVSFVRADKDEEITKEYFEEHDCHVWVEQETIGITGSVLNKSVAYNEDISADFGNAYRSFFTTVASVELSWVDDVYEALLTFDTVVPSFVCERMKSYFWKTVQHEFRATTLEEVKQQMNEWVSNYSHKSFFENCEEISNLEATLGIADF